jgi:hypothetical protein
MFERFKPRAASAGLAATTLALIGSAMLPMQAAAQAQPAATPAGTMNAPAAPLTNDAASDATSDAGNGTAARRVDASAAQMVVRGAATGALRAPTADEAQAMGPRPHTAHRRAAPATLPKVHFSGARGARLHDEFMSYTVVVRQPDGSLAEQCFSSKAEADAAVKSARVVRAVNLPTE